MVGVASRQPWAEITGTYWDGLILLTLMEVAPSSI